MGGESSEASGGCKDGVVSGESPNTTGDTHCATFTFLRKSRFPSPQTRGSFFHALFQRLFLGDALLKRVFLNSATPLL